MSSSLAQEVASLAQGDLEGVADRLTKTAAAERREKGHEKKAWPSLDELRQQGKALLSNPAIAGALGGGALGGVVGGFTARKDDTGKRQNLGRNILSGAAAGAGLGGGLGLAYNTAKDILPKVELSQPGKGLPPNVKEKLPGVVNQISELEQRSPSAAPFAAASDFIRSYRKSHPILSMIGASDALSSAASGAAGFGRENKPMPTLRVNDLLRGARSKLLEDGGNLPEIPKPNGKGNLADLVDDHAPDINPADGLKAKLQKIVEMGTGDREGLQQMLVSARTPRPNGVAEQRWFGISPNMLGDLTERGRGPMGGMPEIIDTLNSINRGFRGPGTPDFFHPLTGSGFDYQGRGEVPPGLKPLVDYISKLPGVSSLTGAAGRGARAVGSRVPQRAKGIFSRLGGGLSNAANNALKSFNTSDISPPGGGRLLPRLALYGGVPLLEHGLGSVMQDRANRREIQRIVSQLRGQ